MALITTNPATAQIEGLTRRLLLERFLRDTGLGQYGTATGGSTLTIIDTTMLQSTAYSSDVNPGAWAWVSYDAGGAAAAPEGDIRAVASTGYAPSTGTLTIAPAFSGATSVASGDKYALFRYLHPQVIFDTLDQVLIEDCYLPCWTVLSEVADYDMEQSVTTEWTGANSTLAKATAEPQGWGKQYLTVASTALGGYAASRTLRVVPSRRYHISALVRANAAGTTPKLIAYDATNSAEIDSKSTTSQTWVRIWFEFNTPSTCNQVTIRLADTENGVTSSWDEVCCYQIDTHDIALPWWVKEKSQVKGFFRARPAGDAGASYLWEPEPVLDIDQGKWDFRDSAFGRGQLRAVARQGGVSGPMYIFGTRNETAYANTNTETKKVDANWVITCLAYRTFLQMSALPEVAVQPSKWVEKQANRWAQEYEKQRRKQSQRLQEVLQSDEPWVDYYSDDWGLQSGSSQLLVR